MEARLGRTAADDDALPMRCEGQHRRDEPLHVGAFADNRRGIGERCRNLAQPADVMLIDAARDLAPEVDLLLFAQASMTRLAPEVEPTPAFLIAD